MKTFIKQLKDLDFKVYEVTLTGMEGHRLHMTHYVKVRIARVSTKYAAVIEFGPPFGEYPFATIRKERGTEAEIVEFIKKHIGKDGIYAKS